LRWEPFLPIKWSDGTAYNVDLNAWAQGVHTTRFTSAPAGLFFPGDPQWTGSSSSAQTTQWKSFSPRLGLAWDVNGDGRTSVRAAYGLFKDITPMAFQINVNNSPPYQPRITVNNAALDNPWATNPGGNPFPVSSGPNAIFPAYGVYTIQPPNLHPSQTSQWNLSIQRQVGTNWLLSASYIGSHTAHLWTMAAKNPSVFLGLGPCTLAGVQYTVCSTTANVNSRRVLSLQNAAASLAYGSVNAIDDGDTASYNALVLNVQRRLSRGVTINSNYTWSHCISDPFTTILGGTGTGYTNPGNRHFDRGDCSASAVDRRQLFNLSGVLSSPDFGNPMVQKVAGGWKFSPILKIMTGSPLTVTTSTDVALTNISNQRVTQILPNVYGSKTAQNYLNASAFALPAMGTLGNMGGPNIQGPGWWTFNTALVRTFKVREAQQLEFRWEVFNLTNSLRLGNPSTAFGTSTFGQYLGPSAAAFSSTVSGISDPRIMQFAMKYVF
jgi:hypothetical protein